MPAIAIPWNTRPQALAADVAPLGRSEIARFSPRQFAEMTDAQLVELVRSVPELPCHARADLQWLDRCTLERLAHLARRCCRRAAEKWAG